MCFLASRIIFRMVFNSKPSISCFYLLEACVSWNLKNVIIVSFSLGEMLLKEFLLMLVIYSILFKEFFKSFVSIIKRVFWVNEFIIVKSSIPIGKGLISFTYFIKSFLSVSAILFMFVRMPLPRQLLIGLLYVKWSSICWNL